MVLITDVVLMVLQFEVHDFHVGLDLNKSIFGLLSLFESKKRRSPLVKTPSENINSINCLVPSC